MMRDFFGGLGAYIFSDLLPVKGFDIPARSKVKRAASPERRAARAAQKRARAITRRARKRGKS